MSITDELLLTSLADLCNEQIRQAGQRYTPGVDPQAPNLRVASLFTAIENLACGRGALARFQTVVDDLSKAWDQAKSSSTQPVAIQLRVDATRAALLPMIVRLRARDLTAGEEWVELLTGLETALLSDMAHWRAEEDRLSTTRGEQTYSRGSDSIRGKVNIIGRCLSVVREEKDFTQTAAFKVLCDPQLLISGEWGTGKTHLLCDVSQDRIDRGQGTVLILAKNFQGRVVEEICDRIEAGRTAEQIFDHLQETSDRLGERSVVVIDGINEGNRPDWRQAITALRRLVRSRPSIGLVVTCRTPFESIAIPKEDLGSFHMITHYGFDDQEFDAQAAFFDYYKLPLPEVPLLDKEFSRPLTLKLICQSLHSLKGKKRADGFAGIASGQKGMTFILESFVNQIGKAIDLKYALRQKGCWLLLKGGSNIADSRSAGFAPCMAATLRGYVRPSEADRIIAANYPDFSPARRRGLLEALRTNGLLEEDAIWFTTKSGTKSRVVFRLPYQRFSDHLIARHLLAVYLDVSTEAAIKKSFVPGSPLARVFKIPNRHQREYAEPGWAQALITEFPERVGARLPEEQRELFYALPRRSQNMSAYFGPFIDGLFWRNPDAFTEGTNLIINHCLRSHSRIWEQVIDVLAAVATKPRHPYHARRLYDFLAQSTMPDRDLHWSEYVRRKYASPTIHRLLTWASKLDTASMTEPSAKPLVVLLSLVLTTVVRNDRDLATKALVLIGEKFPETLFEHAVIALEFNDPYLSERLLAAAYGVTLSLVDSEKAPTFRPVLGAFANTIYEEMFGPNARHATHHTLKRDYALGIIEIAQSAKSVNLPTVAATYLTSPFPQIASTFTSDGTPDTAVTEAIGHAIQMDFGNYTMGRLIPDRANYDDKNLEYVKVRAKIERRIFDLGYRKERFELLERDIGHSSSRSHEANKVDRYGKKYSWIAYFEMWGERESARALPDWRRGERTSDCDVDPSFPKQPPEWNPEFPDLFGDPTTSTESWVGGGFTPQWDPLLVVPTINGLHGEWVLLDGYACGADEGSDRELFAFLRGLFVARRDVRRLQSEFMTIDYPGNGEIPKGAEEHYLYAGEAGRRTNYANHLHQKNGRYRRQTASAFDRYKTLEVEDNESAPTITVNFISPDINSTETSAIHVLARPLRTRRVPGIRVELPSIEFSWESYHSAQNNFSGFDLPAPSLIQRLGLTSKNREIDFFDETGRPGTLWRTAGDAWKGNRHTFLYIRADLLRKYLRETRQVLVWCNWGERDWLKKMQGFSIIDNPARSRIYQAHKHIHRSFSQWLG